MANNLKSMITVVANDEAIANLDERLNGVEYGSVVSFANAFYDNVEMSGDGVLNSWSVDNLGSKWTTFYDNNGGGDFSIESAWYPPKEFFVRLYKVMAEIDPEVVIEVMYEDETYSPVGAFVVKKDKDGVPCIWQEEEDELENPTDEMDWDDEGFDEAQEQFMDELYEVQQSLLNACHQYVETDGEPIEEVATEE